MIEGSATRGRPRNEATRRAVLAAADELLLEKGLDAVSMDELAERAGCSKATIYRWWSSKHLLALDALLIAWEQIISAHRDTGSLRGDLKAVMRAWVRELGDKRYGRVIAELVAEVHRNAEFAQTWRMRFIEQRRKRGREIFARAIERGEIAATTDVELALDLLFGPVYNRLLHGHAPLTARFADQVVDAVVAGFGDASRSA